MTPPCSQSQIIKAIKWAPKNEIIRMAKGSDNWPTTWGADNLLYTAYGDGNGFEPYVPQKLSLGMAAIHGDPPHLIGENILTKPAYLGDGAKGIKASGLLM